VTLGGKRSDQARRPAGVLDPDGVWSVNDRPPGETRFLPTHMGEAERAPKPVWAVIRGYAPEQTTPTH
jgi:hypothetical protein